MNCVKCSIDSSSVRKGYKLNCRFNQLCLCTLGPVISNKAGDITLPRKSLLILPRCFPLSRSPAVSQPGHFTCKCRLNFSCQSAPDTPHRHTCVSQLLSCCLSIAPSALQSALATHCLLVGTVPRLAPSQTCFATPDWQNAPSLSLHTPDSPHILSSECLQPSPPPLSVFILHRS